MQFRRAPRVQQVIVARTIQQEALAVARLVVVDRAKYYGEAERVVFKIRWGGEVWWIHVTLAIGYFCVVRGKRKISVDFSLEYIGFVMHVRIFWCHRKNGTRSTTAKSTYLGKQTLHSPPGTFEMSLKIQQKMYMWFRAKYIAILQKTARPVIPTVYVLHDSRMTGHVYQVMMRKLVIWDVL